MQVTQQLQETAVLAKVSNSLAMQEHDCFKSCSNSVGIESGVVGIPFANLLNDNGRIEVHFRNVHAKHNVIHPVILKFFDKEVNDKESVFHDIPIFQLFYEYK